MESLLLGGLETLLLLNTSSLSSNASGGRSRIVITIFKENLGYNHFNLEVGARVYCYGMYFYQFIFNAFVIIKTWEFI